SAAGALGFEAPLRQLLHQFVAVVALDFNATILDRAARAALFLQLRGERGELVFGQPEAGDDGHALAFAALSLATDAHHAIAGRLAWRALFADTFAHRAQAVRTPLTDAGRINDSAPIRGSLARGL